MLYNTVWVRWSGDTQAVPIVLAEKEDRPLVLEDVFAHFELSSEECVLFHDDVQLNPRLKLNLVNPDEVLVLYEKGPHGGVRECSASSRSRSRSSCADGVRFTDPLLPPREMSVETPCEAVTMASLRRVSVDLKPELFPDEFESEPTSSPPRIVSRPTPKLLTAMKKDGAKKKLVAKKVSVGTAPKPTQRSKASVSPTRRALTQTFDAPSATYGSMQGYATEQEAGVSPPAVPPRPRTSTSPSGAKRGTSGKKAAPAKTPRDARSSSPEQGDTSGLRALVRDLPRLNVGQAKRMQTQASARTLASSRTGCSTYRTMSPKGTASSVSATQRRPSQSPNLTSGTFRRPMTSPKRTRSPPPATKVHRAPAAAALSVEDACAKGRLAEVPVEELSKFLKSKGLSGQGGRKTLTARIERFSAAILKHSNFRPVDTQHAF
eukprot:TRINITY_DN18879_c0_g1_i1.p1 TRINITY_DN18879_c0_g1~~TRINITY_DN18879_c0_g1_i1.p1  ORF type:complete len:434 (+),score=153.82 TRINITY_DN18879_c0_g1_i1:45-1346(+)